MTEYCRDGLILRRDFVRLSKEDEFFAHLVECSKCRKAHLKDYHAEQNKIIRALKEQFALDYGKTIQS